MASAYISSQELPELDYQHQSTSPHSTPTSLAPTPNIGDFVSPTNDNSCHLSDLSDTGDDPFVGYGGDYSEDITYPFLEDDAIWPQPFLTNNKSNNTNAIGPHCNATGAAYPLTPDQTASTHSASPRIDPTSRCQPNNLITSISPQVLQKSFQHSPIIPKHIQLTPSQSSSERSSEDGLAPVSSVMSYTSPQVTVSVWDKDSKGPTTESFVRSFSQSSNTAHHNIHSAGDLIAPDSFQDNTSVSNNTNGWWEQGSLTERAGRTGLEPQNRPTDEVPSINELASHERRKERNSVVGQWLEENLVGNEVPKEASAAEIQAIDSFRHEIDDAIPMGSTTENQYKEGQAYYTKKAGGMNHMDREWIASGRNFEDAPMLPKILTGARHQPQTSQAAIERFERMCRDTDSILSRSATWGTRRRNSTSTVFDVESLAGNLLKKLSIKEKLDKDTRPGDFLRGLREMVRRPSIGRSKRRNSNQGEGGEDLERQSSGSSSLGKRDSVVSPLLAPPERNSSWGKRSNTPNISSMIASMGSSVASIGTTHTRKASIGAYSRNSPPLNPPHRSPSLSLKVHNTITKRPRSSSAAVTSNANESHPGITYMWRTSGGPPVAPLVSSNSKPNHEPEDEEDDDDDGFEDDLRKGSNLIDGVTPNLAGFQHYVTALNPALADNAPYLVDRIAHQQVVRYKQLLNHTVKHLQLGARCPSAHLCMAMGGRADVLDTKHPLSTQSPDDDDNGTPIEGSIAQDSFPPDIPMPPTNSLPAELECQLCYTHKRFQKPSDWTKHVHEDVQPFTCTWDKCRDAKSFKRKADWVRHENEGHRHLEWWTCDVDECRHTCYRRDNFLQHLVREHKYPEPKLKTKTAIKKAGGVDPAWQKVEQCHVLTNAQPQDEPCRFCGKVLPTWKKLTVHLAKHMEQISLPVLRLVAAKVQELNADTIISPVQDLPPPAQYHLPSLHQTEGSERVSMSAAGFHDDEQPTHVAYPGPFTTMPARFYSDPEQHFSALNSTLHHDHQNSLRAGLTSQRAMSGAEVSNFPLSSGQYGAETTCVAAQSSNNLEPFPAIDPLGVGMPMDNNLLMYGNSMATPFTVNGSAFSGHGSVSPYQQSPYMETYTTPDDVRAWDDKQTSGFLG